MVSVVFVKYTEQQLAISYILARVYIYITHFMQGISSGMHVAISWDRGGWISKVGVLRKNSPAPQKL